MSNNALSFLAGLGQGYLGTREARKVAQERTQQQAYQRAESAARLAILQKQADIEQERATNENTYKQGMLEEERLRRLAGETDIGAQTIPSPGMGTMTMPGRLSLPGGLSTPTTLNALDNPGVRALIEAKYGQRNVSPPPPHYNTDIEYGRYLTGIGIPKENLPGVRQEGAASAKLTPEQKARLDVFEKVISKAGFIAPDKLGDYMEKGYDWVFQPITQSGNAFDPSRLTGKAKSEYSQMKAEADKGNPEAVSRLNTINSMPLQEVIRLLEK